MKNILILLIACVVCAGCKKSRTAVVKGRVINPITGEGFEGYEIWLQRTTSGSIGTSGGFQTIKTTITDANGNFEISGKGNGGLNIRCVDGENYSIGWYQNGQKVNGSTQIMDVQKGEETYAEYHSVPYMDVYISLKNINCEGSSDEMYGQKKYQFSDSQNYNGHDIPTIGCHESITQANIQAGYHYYIYTVTRPSGTNTVYDTIFVDPNGINDTVYLEY